MTVRVLIVDDSRTMRGLIAACLREDRAIEVVGEAADPLEARQAIKSLNPDVMTLDVEMPKMNGLDFLEKVMRLRPMPVLMVSTLTERGADATIEALQMGAFDCVAKPSMTNPDTFATLAAKVKLAASARMRPHHSLRRGADTNRAAFAPGRAIVAIGSSTGGVEALTAILASFPANCPPTVITQHMPALFTKTFATRLDRTCAPEIREAADGAPLTPGRVYVAPGGARHLEIAGSHPLECRLRAADAVNGHRPSVDVLFHSVAAKAGANAVGVILTGMGADGAQGLIAMRRAGARTLGQDAASSVVYGMPRVAFELGAVEQQLPLHLLADRILEISRLTDTERA